MVVFVLDFVSIRSDQNVHVYSHLTLKTKPLDNSCFSNSVLMHMAVLAITYFGTRMHCMSQTTAFMLTVPPKGVLHRLRFTALFTRA